MAIVPVRSVLGQPPRLSKSAVLLKQVLPGLWMLTVSGSVSVSRSELGIGIELAALIDERIRFRFR